MRVSLSKRKHLPVLKANNCSHSFPFWKFNRIRSLEKSGLEYNNTSAFVWISELPCGCYLPPFSLKNKVVLDIGACCGETAYYFLLNGARKVICVECDDECIRMLNDNKRNLGLNIDIIPERFNLKHLDIPHDFVKCDIESGEAELLQIADRLKPCVVEVHSPSLKRLFEDKGFHVIRRINWTLFIMANYVKR